MNIIDVHFRIILAASIVAVLLMLTACATDQQGPEIGEDSVRYGSEQSSALQRTQRSAPNRSWHGA
jgi:hypothetical protein